MTNIFNGKYISLIKIDVEGAELDVINELFDIINYNRPYLLVEILPVYQTENKDRLIRQQKIEKIFNEIGYQKYRILKDKNEQFMRLDPILEIGIHDRMDWCEYLFSPTSHNLTF